MSRYWYFCATLPGFLFGDPPPMSKEEYLERCQRALTQEDFALIRDVPEFLVSLKELPPHAGHFIREFSAWERGFKNELSRLRARSYAKDEALYVRQGLTADLAKTSAALCFSITDPYQAEIAFDKERWNTVDRLAALSAFDTDFLVAYRIKLLIASRQASLTQEAGFLAYKALYKEVLDRANVQTGLEVPGATI